MGADEYDVGRRRIWGLRLAFVDDNKDPERRGRVRLRSHGIVGEKGVLKWAEPLGMPGAGGYPGGGFTVPAIGAQVAVGFFLGDIDAPYYFAGPPALLETPAKVLDKDKEECPKVYAFETDSFEVHIIDTETEKKLVLAVKGYDSVSGANGERIELDLIDRSVHVRAGRTIHIESGGVVQITGAKVQVNGRSVWPLGKPA
jgi:hypothetical protein